jgi:hypothetical protein|tara:strand:- start:5032 stop:5244 length:213 start_codon:yes stop_codon:yes gene_type:complete
MSKSNQMFQEEREKEPTNLAEYLDAQYQEIEEVHVKQKQVLNEIFEAWGEIFGAKNVSQKIESNDENKNL